MPEGGSTKMSDSEHSDVDDLSPTLSERSGLLVSRSREDGYNSNGETQQLDHTSDEEPQATTEYISGRGHEREGHGRRRRPSEEEGGGEEERRRRRGRQSTEEEQDQGCFLDYCWKACLNALPAIGDEEEEEDTEAYESALRFGAQQVMMLIVPVTICMAVVVIFELSVAVKEPPSNAYFLYTPFNEDSANSGGQQFLFALLNALIVVALVVVMTVVLVCLFKYRCYRAIFVWLLIASGSLLFVFSSLYFLDILQVHNLPIDWLSFAFWIWNFGVVGLAVIHWKGPLRLQQAYLIVVSALVATRFLKYLPDWTTWVLLGIISIYDLVAVLCPKGPLRVLVETAKERNEPIFPSLIYSSTMVWIVGMADQDDGKKAGNKKDKDKKKKGKKMQDRQAEDDKSEDKKSDVEEGLPQERPQRRSSSQDSSGSEGEGARREAIRDIGHSIENPDRRHASPRSEEEGQSRPQQRREGEQEEEQEEPRGFKLGLGDFIFYSILVGKAAHDSNGDWVIISSCFVAIVIGLCMTSLILGMVRRALPALPISIFFGLMFYFSSKFLLSPFVSVLATTQVFI